jgi:2,4-dienoyl-CoA reductase-like NADH-dependent reductase (Old Yellow Enzyme family)
VSVNDPLMSPFVLKNVTLRNRIVSTSHEPACSEDGLPKAGANTPSATAISRLMTH